MDEPRSNASRPAPLGIYDSPGTSGVTGVEITAIVLSALWLAGAGLVFLMQPAAPDAEGPDTLRLVMMAMAVILPVAMIWVAATVVRASRAIREESQQLQATIAALRQAYVAQSQGGGAGPDGAVTRRLDEIAATARRSEGMLTALHAGRGDPTPEARQPAPPSDAAPKDDQPTLALGGAVTDRAPPLPAGDFIRALNFPESAEDREGFTALRRALKDRLAGQLIQAAQDVLTLLSQEGIYMDDLAPDRARPEVWRSFAKGARGKEISGLGGIRDRSSLALTAARMKKDPIFRDAAHHFLRKFDRTFAVFEPEATDEEIAALADTRTARAFMLLGRVAGTFD